MAAIVLGGGCFWCLEASYQLINGVTGIISGYSGGSDTSPTYEKVCAGVTGHAEVVKVGFDEAIINLEQILAIFWTIHDPTTLNQQGADIGTQYRSVIFYSDASQRDTLVRSLKEAQALVNTPIVTEVQPLIAFYKAESYHQDYFNKHPEQSYCQFVIEPKLQKLRQHFADQLVS